MMNTLRITAIVVNIVVLVFHVVFLWDLVVIHPASAHWSGLFNAVLFGSAVIAPAIAIVALVWLRPSIGNHPISN